MMRSQNNPLPVIVVAEEGQEQKVIQAFRLGAVDSIQWPAHEPEVINVVERCLEQIHIKREREALSDNLHRVNETLKQRVDDLVAVYNMGRSVTSITDLTLLFNTILENGLKVSHADIGWMLVLDEPSHRFVLEAYSNLPESFSAYLHKPWDDGISSIVAQSGKPYNAMGETLVDRKIGFLGKSVLIVPIKVRGQIRGVIVTMRKKAEAFTRNEQALLEALTDYASIALVNAFLLDSVKERAKRWEKSATFSELAEKVTNSRLQTTRTDVSEAVKELKQIFQELAAVSNPQWTEEQLKAINEMQYEIKVLEGVATSLNAPCQGQQVGMQNRFKVNVALNTLKAKLQPFFEQCAITLDVQLLLEDVEISGYPCLFEIAVEGLSGIALRLCRTDGKVQVTANEEGGKIFIFFDSDTGERSVDEIKKAWEEPEGELPFQQRCFSGLSSDLQLMKSIAPAMNAILMVEQAPSGGTRLTLRLPMEKNQIKHGH